MHIVLESRIREYLNELSNVAERLQVERYFERQGDLGYRVQMPVSAFLRDGIYEMRPGCHRLLYFYHKGGIVVVHAFRKKTNRTPEKEIEKALRKRMRCVEGI